MSDIFSENNEGCKIAELDEIAMILMGISENMFSGPSVSVSSRGTYFLQGESITASENTIKSIDLEPTEEGFRPITGEAGRKDKKKNPLTVIIDKINERYGTDFTEMDKVLLQIESDYEAQDKWHGYAQNNDLKTFMLLFEKDFPNMAASRYEQNEEFFVRMFKEPDMMKQIMDMLGTVLYEKLKRKSDVVYSFEPEVSMVAEEVSYGKE